jgi:hypothetical protein
MLSGQKSCISSGKSKESSVLVYRAYFMNTESDNFCNPILFAIPTSTFGKLCKNLYNDMYKRAQ